MNWRRRVDKDKLRPSIAKVDSVEARTSVRGILPQVCPAMVGQQA